MFIENLVCARYYIRLNWYNIAMNVPSLREIMVQFGKKINK